MHKILLSLLFFSQLAMAQDQDNELTSQVLELLKDSSASNQSIRNWPAQQSKLKSRLVAIDGKNYQGLKASILIHLHRADTTTFLFKKEFVSADFELNFNPASKDVEITAQIKMTEAKIDLPARHTGRVRSVDSQLVSDKYSTCLIDQTAYICSQTPTEISIHMNCKTKINYEQLMQQLEKSDIQA